MSITFFQFLDHYLLKDEKKYTSVICDEHYLTLMYTCGHVLDVRVNLIHASSNSIENEHI